MASALADISGTFMSGHILVPICNDPAISDAWNVIAARLIPPAPIAAYSSTDAASLGTNGGRSLVHINTSSLGQGGASTLRPRTPDPRALPTVQFQSQQTNTPQLRPPLPPIADSIKTPQHVWHHQEEKPFRFTHISMWDDLSVLRWDLAAVSKAEKGQ
mmetsp:Transcript_42242/g.88703  ORF Transcript_42242/g.88703 Transcript_42242/m.88703 type:complete len:159 (-) Transcript_42242:332-808(-)